MLGSTNHANTSKGQKRSLHKVMLEINTELAKLHKTVARKINLETYTYATQFADQYISYTSIWNIKFTYNLESPEVALLQLLHLDYILAHESANNFAKERAVVMEMQKLFNLYKPYSDDMIVQRRLKMLDYIEGKI